MNQQPILKQDPEDTKHLLLHSVFYTIQGEGPFAGEPAIFVRLGGCNLTCPQCDTEYTNGNTPYAAEGILDLVTAIDYTNDLVVITGGEPFRQRIGRLVGLLLDFGYRVQIETNGTLFDPLLPYGHIGLTIVCSPKAGTINRLLARHINAYKYVMAYDDSDVDGLPIHVLGNTAVVARPHPDFRGTIYLQPEDSKHRNRNARNLTAVVESCLNNGYTLGIQIHKLIGVD